MKKFLLLAFVCSALPAFSYDIIPEFVNSMGSPAHDRQILEDQMFRRSELDYNGEVQTEKKKCEKRNKTAEQKTQEVKDQIQQAVQRRQKNMGQSQFVQENGQLKIKYGN